MPNGTNGPATDTHQLQDAGDPPTEAVLLTDDAILTRHGEVVHQVVADLQRMLQGSGAVLVTRSREAMNEFRENARSFCLYEVLFPAAIDVLSTANFFYLGRGHGFNDFAHKPL